MLILMVQNNDLLVKLQKKVANFAVFKLMAYKWSCWVLESVHVSIASFLSITASCFSVKFPASFCLCIFQVSPCDNLLNPSNFILLFFLASFLACSYCFSWFRFLSCSCHSISFVSMIPITIWSLLMDQSVRHNYMADFLSECQSSFPQT